MLLYLPDWRPIVLPSLCFEVFLSLLGIQTWASFRRAVREKGRGSTGNTDPLRCRLLVAFLERQRGKSYRHWCGWSECSVCSVHSRRQDRIFWKPALKEHCQSSVKGAFCGDDCWALKSKGEFFSAKRPVRQRVADGNHFSTITDSFRRNEPMWKWHRHLYRRIASRPGQCRPWRDSC